MGETITSRGADTLGKLRPQSYRFAPKPNGMGLGMQMRTECDVLTRKRAHRLHTKPNTPETNRLGPRGAGRRLRDRGGRHTDLAAPHPAAPPRCTGPGRGTPPPRPLRTHRWAGPAAPLRPPLAPRAAPRLRLLSFSHPLFGVSVLIIYSHLNRPRLVSLSSPDGIEVCNLCIWTQAGYMRICV